MFGIGKTNFSSPMTAIYLFLFILIANQFLIARSFRLMSNDDQNELDDSRRSLIRRLAYENFGIPNDSSSDDNDAQSILKPTVQRRFCCMSPLSGRKRSVRDLARQQIETNQQQ